MNVQVKMVVFPVPEKFNTFNTFTTFDPLSPATALSSPPHRKAARRHGVEKNEPAHDSPDSMTPVCRWGAMETGGEVMVGPCDWCAWSAGLVVHTSNPDRGSAIVPLRGMWFRLRGNDCIVWNQ